MRKNIIITGSNRGIGLELVRRLYGEYNIWACARKHNEEFEKELFEIENKVDDGWIKPVYFDLENSDEIRCAFKSIFDEKKNVDALINNAGISTYNQPFTMSSMAQAKKIYDINVFAVMELTQYALKRMIRQKSGTVINIASICAFDVLPSNTIYGSSKAAIVCFTRNLAAEVGKYGIRVNAVAPGPTDTDIIAPVKEYFEGDYLKGVPLGKIAQKQDIVNCVSYLLSDESSYITGQCIRVDGGKF